MIPERKKRVPKFKRVRPFWQFKQFNPEHSYEIPLIELIIRKGMGKQAKANIGKFNPIIHRRDYFPSSAYKRFIARYHPLTSGWQNS